MLMFFRTSSIDQDMQVNPNNPDRKFHFDNRNMTLTAKEKLKNTDVETYLKRHLSEFPKGTNFIALCGQHHDEAGHLMHNESNLIGDYISMFQNLIKSCKTQCEEKCNECTRCKHFQIWKEKGYTTQVVPLFSKEIENERYKLNEVSRHQLRKLFENLSRTGEPNVFIHASCFSYYSEINNILRSHGLFSVLATSSERGNITEGNIYTLFEDQKDFLKLLTENIEEIKDIIINGNVPFFCT